MRKILLVEGPDDEHVFKGLCGHYDLPWLDEIKQHGGYVTLLDAFPVRLKESDVEALGVVIDADENLSSRWDAISNRLREKGYEVPRSPDPTGLVLNPPKSSMLPRVGVWIMPNNQVPGILEDFIRELVPPGDGLFIYAEKCIDSIEPPLKKFRALDLPKVRMHTWLAWQAEPGRPLGQSITMRVLDADLPKAKEVVAWLERLFYTP